jgi:small-conductance mechanosensitive channel/CRP-like cAMP-binding protein
MDSFMLASLETDLIAPWQMQMLEALLAVALMLLILLRTRPEGKVLLRSALLMALLAVLLLAGSAITQALMLSSVAEVMNEIAVILVGVMVIRIAGITLFRAVLPVVSLHPPRILEDILIVLGYIAWGMVRLRHAGVELSGLVTTSAVITGIVAFSMQETLGNILGGLALQLDKSILIGDWIEVDNICGRVIEVHWRHTAVRTRNGEIEVLPNSLLMKSKVKIISSEQVQQWRRWIRFAVNQKIPPQQVIQAVEKAVAAADIPHVSKAPLPSCVLLDMKDGVCLYGMRYWLTNPLLDDPTDSDVRIHIYAALRRHDQPLANPILDVNLTTESSERDTRLRERELARRKEIMRNVELFSLLSDEELEQIASNLTVAPFVRGDVITRQGAVAHWLYILVNGEADVWFEPENATKPRRHLLTLTAGRVFGEMGLMTGAPRSATVTARTDAECFRLDKANFEQILHSRPQLAEGFANILAQRHMQSAQALAEQVANPEQLRTSILNNIRRFFRLRT